jgi:hypothetical protein
MNALTIFKNAELSDKLAAKFDFNPALLGAGLGAAGLGLSSAFGAGEDDGSGHKNKHILRNMLTGAALGGAGGLGVGAFKQHFGDTGSAPNIQNPKLTNDQVDQLQQKMHAKGKELDLEPFSYHHPVQSAHKWLNSLIGWKGAAGAGAAHGVYKNYKLNSGGEQLAVPQPYKPSIIPGAKTPPGAEQRAKEAITKYQEAMATLRDHSKTNPIPWASNSDTQAQVDARKTLFDSFVSRANVSKQPPEAALRGLEQLQSEMAATGRPPSADQLKSVLDRIKSQPSHKGILSGNTTPIDSELRSRYMKNLEPSTTGNMNSHSWQPAATAFDRNVMQKALDMRNTPIEALGAGTKYPIGQGIANKVNKWTKDPYMTKNIGRYAGSAAKGAAQGIAAERLSKLLANVTTRLHNYDPEQVALWNAGGA